MNFKLKTLVAAAVLAVSATSANAAIEGMAAGNGELVFSAWDINTGIGYTYDLLSTLALTDFVGADAAATAAGNPTMLANAVVSNSLITGPNGQILDLALTGLPFSGNFSNVQWNLAASDNTGRVRLLVTKDVNDTQETITTNRAKDSANGFNGYFSQANSFMESLAGDTYALTNDTNGAAYPGTLGATAVGNLFDSTNLLGTSSFMYLVAPATLASSNAAGFLKQMATANGENLVATTYQQAGQWRLNLSVAQTAPIPEPETYAMFLAGLGMMGAVARRRKGQVK
jgi:ribosomal protein L34